MFTADNVFCSEFQARLRDQQSGCKWMLTFSAFKHTLFNLYCAQKMGYLVWETIKKRKQQLFHIKYNVIYEKLPFQMMCDEFSNLNQLYFYRGLGVEFEFPKRVHEGAPNFVMQMGLRSFFLHLEQLVKKLQRY